MNPQDPWQQNQPQTPPPQDTSLPPLNHPQYSQTPPAAPQQPVYTQTPQPMPQQNQPSFQPIQPLQTANQPNPADYSIDYLNSIAPNQQKTVGKFAIFGLIGGIVIAAIVAVILISAPKGSSSAQLIPPLEARIETLKTVTSAQQKRLNENKISETNASLNSALGTMTTDLENLASNKSKKKVSTTSEKTYAEKLTKTLDEAYQRGTLDRTYTSQMIYELTILDSKISSLKKASKAKDVQAFTETAANNIDLVLQSYNAFDTSKQ